jgi:hypothetical protein
VGAKSRKIGVVQMAKRLYIIGVFIIFLIISLVNWSSGYTAGEPIPSPTPTAEFKHKEIEQIENAVISEILSNQGEKSGHLVIGVQLESIRVSEDNSYATGWIVRIDPETGEVMPAEPGIFVAKRTDDVWAFFYP